MYNNSNQNVISLSSGKALPVGSYDDPLQELLHEFDEQVVEAQTHVHDDVLPTTIRPDFSLMSEEMLLDYVDLKISSLKENTRRVHYYTSEIELHHDV